MFNRAKFILEFQQSKILFMNIAQVWNSITNTVLCRNFPTTLIFALFAHQDLVRIYQHAKIMIIHSLLLPKFAVPKSYNPCIMLKWWRCANIYTCKNIHIYSTAQGIHFYERRKKSSVNPCGVVNSEWYNLNGNFNAWGFNSCRVLIYIPVGTTSQYFTFAREIPIVPVPQQISKTVLVSLTSANSATVLYRTSAALLFTATNLQVKNIVMKKKITISCSVRTKSQRSKKKKKKKAPANCPQKLMRVHKIFSPWKVCLSSIPGEWNILGKQI